MRDLLVTLSVLAVLAGVICVGYGVYFGIGIATELRQEAVINSQRTSNDLVIDYSEEIYSAMLKSGYDNDGNITRDLGKLVDAGYLREIPVNPFTGQPVEFIRIGKIPNAGNLSVVTGWEEEGKDDGSYKHRYEVVLIVAYGKPDMGYFKYANRRFDGWNNCNTLFGPRLPDEIDETIVQLDGGVGGCVGKMTQGFYGHSQSLEDALLADGYTLPIQVVNVSKSDN